MENSKNRIKTITLISDSTENSETDDFGESLVTRDRKIALNDLAHESVFQPACNKNGPYTVELSIEENRLVIRMRDSADSALPMLVLALKPYRRLIKDYFMIVRSYDDAIQGGNPSRIEAIDMGRRGLHNEGATLLLERLEDKITMDFNTARRLFTLICVLHSRKSLLWR